MADIYTMTPGSAVADTLQQILQRRRDEQRQMMLDRLGLAKFDQDVTEQNRRFDLDTKAEARHQAASDQVITESKERVLGDQIKSLPRNSSMMSDDFANSPLGKELQNRGRLSQVGVNPQVGTNTDIQPPQGLKPEELEMWARALEGSNPADVGTQMESAGPSTKGWQWSGSDDFQQEEEERKRIDQFLAGEFSKSKDPIQLAGQAAKAGIQLPASAYPNTTRVISPGGNLKSELATRAGDDILELNHPPSAGISATTPYIYQQENDWDGNGRIDSFWLRPGEQPVLDGPGANVIKGGQMRRGNEPTAAAPAYVTPSAWNALTTAMRRGNDPEAVYNEKVRQARQGIAGNLSSSLQPEVRNFLTQAISDYTQRVAAGKNKTVSGYINDAQRQGQFTPEDLAIIQQILSGVISGQAPTQGQ